MTRRGGGDMTMGGPAAAQPAPGEAGTDQSGGGQPGGGQPGDGQPGGGRPGGGRGSRRGRRAGDRWRAAFLVALALAIVVGAAWALLGSSLLVVRHVQVAGSGSLPAAEVRAAAGIPLGTPLARLNAAAATQRVEQIAWVLSARVTRSWPDTVVISVRRRTPALAVASGAVFDLVDVNGVVMATVTRRPAVLPLLQSALAPAQLRGSAAVRAAGLVLGDLPGSIRNRVTSVTAADAGSVTLHLRGRITVLWGGPANSAAKARELRALMRTGARSYDLSSPGVAVTGG